MSSAQPNWEMGALQELVSEFSNDLMGCFQIPIPGKYVPIIKKRKASWKMVSQGPQTLANGSRALNGAQSALVSFDALLASITHDAHLFSRALVKS
jgi:hypothetical protein